MAQALGRYSVLGETLDDSIGEAFDKVARMLGLLDDPDFQGIHPGYAVEIVARNGDPVRFAFTEPLLQHKIMDFSFSGMKTAVRSKRECRREDVAASFQHVATKHLLRRTRRAIDHCKVSHLVVCGGVASNEFIRSKMDQLARQEGLEAIYPPSKHCTLFFNC